MNPQGRFKATLYNESIRYGDRDYRAAIERGELDHLLLDVGIQEQRETENLLFDTWLTFLFYRSGWSGCPSPPFPYNEGSTPQIWALYLTTYDTGSEPEYTDDGEAGPYYNTLHSLNYNCGSGCGRRFYVDAIGEETWTDTTGPQDVQSNNNNIRGVWIVWSRTSDDGYGENKRWMGRVRFKDNDGNFVRIHKTNYQPMGLEYTFSMLTV